MKVTARLAARVGALMAISLTAGHWASAEAGLAKVATPTSLSVLLADFDRAYRPSDFTLLPLTDATAGLARAEQRMTPHASLGESLVASWSGEVDLHFDAHLTLPLYSSRAPLALAVAQAGLEAAHIESDAERRSAKAAFLGDLYAAALFGRLLSEAESALGALLSAHSETADVREERATIELAAAAEELRAQLAWQLDAILTRISRALRLPVGAGLDAADLARLLPEVRSSLPLSSPSETTCLAAAPAAAVARARYRQATEGSRLQQVTDVSVELSASTSFSTASGLSAHVSLGAELALPADWPIAGSGTVGVGAGGITQRVELRWPPPPTAPLVGRDPEENLALALEDILQVRRAAAANVEQAASGLELAALRLRWFVQDALGPQVPAGSEDLLDAAPARFEDPVVELQALDLRARLAFAELSLALARIDLGIVCGWSP